MTHLRTWVHFRTLCKSMSGLPESEFGSSKLDTTGSQAGSDVPTQGEASGRTPPDENKCRNGSMSTPQFHKEATAGWSFACKFINFKNTAPVL
jgi:hypothetical protein